MRNDHHVGVQLGRSAAHRQDLLMIFFSEERDGRISFENLENPEITPVVGLEE
jgi:hypothetical protein